MSQSSLVERPVSQSQKVTLTLYFYLYSDFEVSFVEEYFM